MRSYKLTYDLRFRGMPKPFGKGSCIVDITDEATQERREALALVAAYDNAYGFLKTRSFEVVNLKIEQEATS